jgi:hypothetical protein
MAGPPVRTGKLSPQQQALLVRLYEEYTQCPHYRSPTGWGIPWRTHETRSRCSSLSRALRRLEARGLLLRQNWWGGLPGLEGPRQSKDDPHRRSTSVLLLPAGVELARELVNKKTTDNLLTVS